MRLLGSRESEPDDVWGLVGYRVCVLIAGEPRGQNSNQSLSQVTRSQSLLHSQLVASQDVQHSCAQHASVTQLCLPTDRGPLRLLSSLMMSYEACLGKRRLESRSRSPSPSLPARWNRPFTRNRVWGDEMRLKR